MLEKLWVLDDLERIALFSVVIQGETRGTIGACILYVEFVQRSCEFLEMICYFNSEFSTSSVPILFEFQSSAVT